MEYEPILPIKAMVFQVLFLMVAVAIESGILRQRLQLSFRNSVQYATAINLAAVVVGWLAFLTIEPLSPAELKSQIISYVLFDRLLLDGWTAQVGGTLFAIGLVAFFVTFFIKLKGLELVLRGDRLWRIPDKPKQLSRDERYARARQGRTETQQALSEFTDAVILANAASFSAILLLILLRAAAEGWA